MRFCGNSTAAILQFLQRFSEKIALKWGREVWRKEVCGGQKPGLRVCRSEGKDQELLQSPPAKIREVVMQG